ncbi:MAG: hypothetical protein V1811_02530, partial [Candidatus Micrarchaeota archaeon]
VASFSAHPENWEDKTCEWKVWPFNFYECYYPNRLFPSSAFTVHLEKADQTNTRKFSLIKSVWITWQVP